MKMVIFLFALVGLCAVCVGFSYIYGGSNLDFLGYPEFKESTPFKPYARDQYSFDSYKDDVESYLNKAKKYVENAENDKKRIDEAIKDAVKKANTAIEDFNNWAEYGF